MSGTGHEAARRWFLRIFWLSAVFAAGYLAALFATGTPVVAHVRGELKRLDDRLGGHVAAVLYGERIPRAMPAASAGAYKWLDQAGPFLAIAHGLGPQLYGGQNGALTLERAAQQGFRFFEVDVVLTSDGHLVCVHGGENERVLDAMTSQSYVRGATDAGLAPLEFGDLVSWATDHPGTYFVLDVKNRFYDSYRLIIDQLRKREVRQHFIPQAYSFEELAFLRRDQVLAGEIFTAYRSHLSTKAMFEWADRYHLPVITIPMERLQKHPPFPRDIAILVHPVDDPFEAALLRKEGVRGIYTSYVSPVATPEIYADWTAGCIPGVVWRNCTFLQKR